MSRYFGISYPTFLCRDRILKLWKRFCCKRNWHLLDEVLSSGPGDDHYLSCDACNLMVVIKRIDTKYVEPNTINKQFLP